MFRGMRTLYFWPIVVFIVIFAVGILIGALLPASLKIVMLQAVADKFQQILTESTSSWLLSWHIFLNNLLVCTILYVGGFLLLIPLVIIFGNGVMIGVFMSLLYRADVLVPGYFASALASLIPHGIFELSAFFLAGALSVMLVLKLILPQQIEPHILRRTALWRSLIRFVSLVIPLLVIAALVETFISPRLATALQQRSAKQQLDPQLTIQLNQSALDQAHCTSTESTRTLNSSDATNLQASLSILSHTVYDDIIYQALLQRKHAPVWRETLECDSTAFIQIEVWPTQDWSVEQVLLTTQRTLTINQIPYQERRLSTDHGTIERLSYTLAGQNVVQAITTEADKTIVLTLMNPTVGVKALLATPGLTDSQ